MPWTSEGRGDEVEQVVLERQSPCFPTRDLAKMGQRKTHLVPINSSEANTRGHVSSGCSQHIIIERHVVKYRYAWCDPLNDTYSGDCALMRN